MRRTIRRLTIVMTMGAALAGLAMLVPQNAFAKWNATNSGSTYTKARTMPTGNQPSGSVSGRNVTLTWSASTIGGAAVSGYTVARYTTGGTLQTIGAGCSGTISALTCTEAAVPAGSWIYGVTPKQGLWVGAEGTRSATVTVAAATLSFTSSTSITSLPSTMNGNLTGYATGETLTFRLDNASTGTVLTGSTAPTTIPTNGQATFSVTIPTGTTVGAHTVYGVGSLGTTASAGFTVVDNVAPTISAAVINKTAGNSPSYIKQGGTYRVYANVTDAAPSSGISTVTANVTNITTGTTAAAMTAGSYTIGGVSYNYRSASLTASNPLAAGVKTFTITATDVAANSTTSGTYSVTVDNTAPTATDVQANNKTGGTVGKAEIGDTIVYTFSEPIDPNSILANWTGASQNVTVHLNNNTTAGDIILIYNSANSTQLPLGSVDLISTDYTTANITFTASTMVMSGSTITITLGTASGADTTAASAGTMAWTPSATATDLSGNVCSTAAANESGASDKEF